MKKCDCKVSGETLKTIFVVIGAIVSIAALVAVVYTIFKKYFQVSFECDGDCGDCPEECFAEGEEESFEPICCCEEDEEEADEDEEEAEEDSDDEE